ncbi:MAG: nicotinamide-nucleotide adenylyltransferase [Candidatus Bipolaricaulia bacterium]
MNVVRGFYVGRFQPYHNGHQAMIAEIAKEVDELIIAVGSAQQSHELNNPFTAGERVMMISRALTELDLDIVTYVLPFEDIERNAVWVANIHALAPPFHAIYSNNPLVVRLFKEAGIEVRKLPLLNRQEYSGTEIRRRIVNDEPWEHLMPDAVCGVIKEIDGVGRLKELAKLDY